MTNQTNQDPQAPTRDQQPPKQYATQRPGQSGEQRPNPPPQRPQGNDQDDLSADHKSGYDQDSSKGAGGKSGTQQQPGKSGGSGAPGGQQKPGSGGSTGSQSGTNR